MFAVMCPECGTRYLLSVHSVLAVHTVEPGVHLVELACHRGHRLSVLSRPAPRNGSPSTDRADPSAVETDRVPDQPPRTWRWLYAGGSGAVRRVGGRVLRFVERQDRLHRAYLSGYSS